jgi:hypothetical protein
MMMKLGKNMKTKISIMIVTVTFVSQSAVASLCPAISGVIAGAAVIGLGGGLTALDNQERANFLTTHNSSLFNVTGYTSRNETCFTQIGPTFGGISWTKHNFTAYANGQYLVSVDGKSFVQNATKAAFVCGDSDGEALAAIKRGYPQSAPFVIWYEISNPAKFVFDSVYVYRYLGASIVSLAMGGIITIVAGVPLLYTCAKVIRKRLEYTQLEGQDVHMGTAH